MPEKLKALLEDFEFADRTERIDLLIEYADRFQEVPPSVATRPFPEENHVLKCESDAYVWAEEPAGRHLEVLFRRGEPAGPFGEGLGP